MQISPKYNPQETENKWYAYWMGKGLFRSIPNEKPPYTIVIPPPNVTGVLHMGHMLNNTIQDVIIRRARMKGYNACWVPGTDHASIATEAKVVAKLREEGIQKKDISREAFLQHAWEWKEKHGGIILEQLKKLGASCDWERTKFTMDADMYESVIQVFVELYNKGLIYRGVRMVNWDPKALTAVSDEEVIFKEVNSKLYYIKYFIEGSSDFITVATTRPETILGDTAVCVHPEDEKYAFLKGKRVLVPLLNRSVPVIFDEYVDREFGTGCLKITPAHDINDYNLGIKYKLETIDIFNDNGTLNEKAQLYIGEDRFAVRKKISKELEEKGHLAKIEEYANKVGYSERTDEVIEPKLSLQWFMRMGEMAKPALDVVMNDDIKFHPAKFKNTYRHWMENVKDWCISRQLWWGQQIPAWYLPNREIVVAMNAEAALVVARQKFPEQNYQLTDLIQDEDVLDTWFSSWLWPISVFDGIRNPENDDIKYYYPTKDLITAPEILFFWVARMIMAGLEYRNEIPFKNVYLTGIVRDKLGRKMSKSLGNSPDPILLMEQYGADGVRVGMLLTSPAGNDLPFDESLCEQGRNFTNKIWNALRLVKGWEIDENIPQPEYAKTAIQWFESKLNETFAIIEDHYEKYRLSDALMTTYKLIWDDFCSWYLEMIKPQYQHPIDKATYEATIVLFEKLMKILHPFMPFITEEIWHLLDEKDDDNCLMVADMLRAEDADPLILQQFNTALEVVMAIRTFRKEKNVLNKVSISLFIRKNNNEMPDTTFDAIVAKLCNIDRIEYISEKMESAQSFIVKTTEFYVPLLQEINVEEELAKLSIELEYAHKFLNSVKMKLSNERFVNSAPAQVVDLEKKKQSDAEQKIQVLEEQINKLK
ncbi:MAG: valine--tRNA ligase [Bacteroidota bacterium]